MSFYCHSSLISMTSGASPIISAALRYSFACLISDSVYSGMIVFMIFQKYSLSGTRPLGNLSGKYYMNYLSCCIYGQKLRTDNSSYLGTWTRLTLLRLSNFFFPFKTSFKKSLFILNTQKFIMKLALTCIPVASRVRVVLWNTLWSHFLTKISQTTHAAWDLAFLVQVL